MRACVFVDSGWQCSEDGGTSWKPAFVIGKNGQATTLLGRDTFALNLPSSASHIWCSSTLTTRSCWCRVTIPPHVFQSGDRVRLEIHTNNAALCATRPEGATTVYYGQVCGTCHISLAFSCVVFYVPSHRNHKILHRCEGSRGREMLEQGWGQYLNIGYSSARDHVCSVR